MAIYVRPLSAHEQAQLEAFITGTDEELARRAKVVLLSTQRMGVHEISTQVALHPINVRKWIHRFEHAGVDGLISKHSPGRPEAFSRQQRDAIATLAMTDPRALGLGFEGWSLQRLRRQLIERGVVEDVSAETIRQQLLRSGLVFDEGRWIAAA